MYYKLYKSEKVSGPNITTLSIDIQREAFELMQKLVSIETENGIIYSILSDFELLQVNKLFKKTNMVYTMFDISQEVLSGRLPAEVKNNTFLATDVILEFFKREMTVDMILDKISSDGIEALNKFDQEILTIKC